MEKHPNGLYALFATEMWERFSYYGMRAIFILFMTKVLLFDKAFASQVYGSYTGLVYLTPLLGGVVADNLWGNRKSIIIGGIMMAVGQFLMFLSGTIAAGGGIEMGTWLCFAGLAFLIFGNGFFKPNISTMVGQLYKEGDSRVDSAFTIFYMGINLGAFFSPLICSSLASGVGYQYGFLAACIGMLIGLGFFVWWKDKYIVTPEGVAIGDKPNTARDTTTSKAESIGEEADVLDASFVGNDVPVGSLGAREYGIGGAIALALGALLYFVMGVDVIGTFIFSLCIAIPIVILIDPSLTKIEFQRVLVIIIIAFFVIAFWGAFEQAGASLTFFADEQTEREVGMHIPMWSIHLLSVLALGLLFWLRGVIDNFFKTFPEMRYVLYVVMGLVGGVIAYYNFHFITEGQQEIFFKEVPAEWFQSINPLGIVVFAPIFAWIWSALNARGMEPASPVKQAIGLLFLFLGYVVIWYGVGSLAPGAKASMFLLFSMYMLHTFGELCLSPIGLSMVSKLAPARFASLMMGVWFLSTATANKVAGSLSALYPSGAGEFKKAAENGITNLPEILSGSVQATAEQVAKLKELGIADHFPSLLGYQITNLTDFFMIFMLMSGITGILLLLASKKLLEMMHGIR
jgi:proton-dependent oligopeptide transporter, POT family